MRLLAIIGICLLLAYHAASQCDHVSNSKERFDAMRILPPVKVRAFNGSLIEYTYEDTKGVYAGSFTVDKNTVLAQDFSKEFKQGYWWVIYSSCDQYPYVVSRVLEKQFAK